MSEQHPSSRTAALQLAQAGMFVFPVAGGSKTPIVGKWESAASCDPATVARWFPGRADRPRHNIGIATGPSGLVVVDLDVAKPEASGAAPHEPSPSATGATDDGVPPHGRAVFAELCARAGVRWPNTWTIATPSGGMHLYFRRPAGVELRNTASKLGPRVDTRACGGYVLAVGSTLAANPGRAYRVVRRVPIAPLPGWLHQALTPAPARVVAAPQVRHADRYAEVVVADQAAQVAAARTGTRHTTLLRAARILGQLVGGGVLNEADARATLTAAAQHHIGVDGCTSHEVQRTIADGIRFGRALPRTPRHTGRTPQPISL
jgi:hypothetical protein